jgi:hypothetical protein
MDAISSDLRPEFDETAARADLEAHGKRSIRALAEAWGWTAWRVRRFLEAEAPHSEPHKELCEPHTEPHKGRTEDVCGPHSDAQEPHSELPPWRANDGSVDHSRRWYPENEEVVTPGSPALAIFVNEWNHIVICCDSYSEPGAGGGYDEQYIPINPHDAYAVADRLRALANELLGSGGQGPAKERG